ncbi:transposase, partial [Streptomyces scopuliridis]|uniref:transposase n=1 Tax=Streptomyces scopuliridis TaxID=452529 RepID=UPI003680FB24
MSLQPKGLPGIPAQTVAVSRAAFPHGTLAMRVRDRLGEVFADEPFTEAFGRRGAPGLSPAVLSLVTVLQFAENLTDRQAAVMAVRAIDWKYAIGVELTHTGFDASVLSRFRTRLAEYGLERVVFDRLLEVCREQGLVGSGGKQRTDSTHVISAVRDLNRTELAGESVRAALEVLAVAAGGWLADAVDVPELAHRYEERVNGWTMPSSRTKRDRLAVVFGQDALALCRAVWAPGAPGWLREIEPVAFLRRMLVQTYYVSTDARGREVIVKRDADKEGVPPGHLRLASPYDPDARWAAKGDDLFWLGYKVHLTETCDTPAEAEALPLRLITDVLTTEASVPDVRATRPVQQNLTGRGLTPGEHYLDAGYPSADLIHEAAGRGITMVTPALLDHSPQARADAGFQKSAFRIDWKVRQARCPQGRTSTGWFPVRQHGRDAIVVQFARTDCHACPVQDKCTTSARGTRILSLRPKELHETLTDARAEQATKTWKTKYALRAG